MPAKLEEVIHSIYVIEDEPDLKVGRMVMLQRWPPLMEGEWSCYRGGKFNGGGMVLL